MIPTITPFSEAFITQYQPAFEELVRLGTVASQNWVEGRVVKREDESAQKILTVLQALSSDGLTTDDIESLEYCLRKLNASLTIPTVDSLVPAEIVPARHSIDLLAAIYRTEGQSVSFVGARSVVLEPAEYTLQGQSVDFTTVVSGITHTTLSLEPAEYTLSPQEVTFVTSVADLNLGASMVSIAAFQIFRISFDAEIITLVGEPNTDSEAVTLSYTDTVNVSVLKLTNGGIALDSGVINFFKNGGLVSSTPFVTGQDINSMGISHTYTSLVPGDSLSVTIQEG